MNPIRAAKIFGPAFIRFTFRTNKLAIFWDMIEKRLNLELFVERNRKSTTKKPIIIKLELNKNANKVTTVNPPFNRATVSFIFWFEMGQIA